MKYILKTSAAAILAVLLLSGCGSDGGAKEVTTLPAPLDQITAVVDEASLAQMEHDYPTLKEADLTGSTCYEAIEGYMQRNPQVNVRYTVSLGSTDVSPDVGSLELKPGEFDFLQLMKNIRFLPNLQSVHFPSAMLTKESIQILRDAYPGLQVSFSLNVAGMEVNGEVEELDLSAIDPDGFIPQALTLSLLPNLKTVELMAADGTTRYSLDQAAQLQNVIPDVLLHYSFKLFDKQVSTTDAEIVYQGKSIGNQPGAEDTLRQALTILRGCKRFVLDNCRFDNETLARIRDEFRGTTKVVWRIWFGEGGCLTDRKIIRHVYGLYDSNSQNLVYCEDAEYIDFGHNEFLKNCDFVAGMPNLKALIISGSMIRDMTPFENCVSLEFLEISYCGYITDISPLAKCRNLKRLNVAYTAVEDLSALDELNLEVLVDARSKVSTEEAARFESLHPDCLVQHTGDVKDDQPYGYPWRYEPNGDPNPYYALLKEKFNYPNPANTFY